MTNPREEKFKVLQPGISISSKYSTTGTLGLIVFDKKNNYQPSVLSNWHVLAKKSFIPRWSFRSGAPIYQPGKIFGGKRSSNIIAYLTRHDRNTDSAIARIIDGQDFVLNQFESNALIQTARAPKEGDIVEKSGVRTGVTRGKIVGVVGSKVTIKPLDEDNPDNIEISDGGDSGCLWYDPTTMEGLVLHNSGEGNSSPRSEYAGGFSLIQVLERLQVSLTRDN